MESSHLCYRLGQSLEDCMEELVWLLENILDYNWLLVSSSFLLNYLDEGMYAVVGAACVYGSVTKTVSIAIIMFECLGQMELLLPVVLGVTVSYLCTSGMAMCIFDVLLEFKNFPFMPTLGSENSYSLKASDIAHKNFLFLEEESILKDVVLLLQKLGDSNNLAIPILSSKK